LALSGPRTSWLTRKAALYAGAGLVLLLGAIQLVPYGRDHTQAAAPNPFHWRSPEAQALARAACYDCHSSETRWWWAVKLAPFSWLAQSDISEARTRVDFSAWDGRLNASGLQRALNRDMPPWQYTIAHPEARLSASQKQELVQGFRASLGGNARFPGPARAAAPAGLVLASYPGAGRAAAIISSRCASCHSPRYALGFHTTSPARAKAMIADMVRRGARVSPADQAVLIRHFTSQ